MAIGDKPRVLHIVKVGTAKIGIQEPDSYAEIADLVGIKKAGESDQVDDSGNIGELKQRGKLITFTARCAGGKSRRIQCSVEKAAAASAGLKGKNFGGLKIESVSIARRRSRR
jgi:hypothetical protein